MRDRTRRNGFEDLFDDELRRRLDGAAAEHRAALGGALMDALARVRNRGTPLRHAESFGTDGTVRLRFADGTTVLVRGDGKGGLGMAAVAALRGFPVLIADLHHDAAGVHGILTWQGRHHIAFDVLGADQPS